MTLYGLLITVGIVVTVNLVGGFLAGVLYKDRAEVVAVLYAGVVGILVAVLLHA